MSASKENMPEQSGDNNPPRSGNIWGWKFSMISLVGILFFVFLMIFLHLTMEPQNVPSQPPAEDSLLNPADKHLEKRIDSLIE